MAILKQAAGESLNSFAQARTPEQERRLREIELRREEFNLQMMESEVRASRARAELQEMELERLKSEHALGAQHPATETGASFLDLYTVESMEADKQETPPPPCPRPQWLVRQERAVELLAALSLSTEQLNLHAFDPALLKEASSWASELAQHFREAAYHLPLDRAEMVRSARGEEPKNSEPV